MTRSIVVLACALTLALLAVPMRQSAAQEGERAKGNIVVTFLSGDRKVEVMLIGGKVGLRIDGKHIDVSAPVRKKARFDLLDGRGHKVASVDLAPKIKRVIKKQKRRMKIGVNVKAIDPALASQLRLKKGKALLVLGVASGRAAARAGLKIHDVIRSIAGKTPATLDLLKREVGRIDPGGKVTLGIVRGGKAKVIVVTPIVEVMVTTDVAGRVVGRYDLMEKLKSGKYELKIKTNPTVRLNKTQKRVVTLRNDPLILEDTVRSNDRRKLYGDAIMSGVGKRLADLQKRLGRLEKLLGSLQPDRK